MAHGTQVVSRDATCPSLASIEVPSRRDLQADYFIRHGGPLDWHQIEARFTAAHHAQTGRGHVRIGRHVDPQTVDRHVSAWRAGLARAEPRRAAAWLGEWLRGARSVYTIGLDHGDADGATSAVRDVTRALQLATGGCAFAAGEGWSNDDGYLVTWDFDDEHALAGAWNCAVLDAADRWIGFEIELSNPTHRRAFREGRVPQGLPARSLWPV